MDVYGCPEETLQTKSSDTSAEQEEPARPSKPALVPSSNQILLIFQGQYDQTYVGIPGLGRLVYKCRNSPGLPISDPELDQCQQVPISQANPDLMVAVTKILQQDKWNGWFVKCVIQDKTPKKSPRKDIPMNIYARKEMLTAASERVVFARKEKAGLRGPSEPVIAESAESPPSYSQTINDGIAGAT
ncbi:MAG: hypothetical protein Q9227_006599 [Pyrenula ochraceoflavens]